MSKYRIRILGAIFLLLSTFGSMSSSHADTGSVRVIFTKGGFIMGVGSGHGVLNLRGHNYRFSVSGMSMGFTIGASTTRLVGLAHNLREPSDIQGSYNMIGAGGALAAGAGTVQLQNQRGVILQLSGGKVGMELSVALGGVFVALQ